MVNDGKFTAEEVADSAARKLGSRIIMYVPDHFFKGAKSIRTVSQKGKGIKPVKFANKSFKTFHNGIEKSKIQGDIDKSPEIQGYIDKNNALRTQYDETFKELSGLVRNQGDNSYSSEEALSLVEQLSKLHVEIINIS